MEIIKYKIDGDFVEGEFYYIKFDLSLCVKIVTLDSIENSEGFLNSINGQTITMQYKGKSRIDNMSIFVISPKQTIRDLKLRNIL